MDARFEYVELLCDSQGAKFSNSTAPSTNWPRFFFGQKNFNPVGIKIISAEIPFVFDTISSLNNTFYLITSGITSTISISPNTFTGPSLATELQAKLNATGGSYTVTYDPLTFKYTISSTASFQIQVPEISIAQYIGFPVGTHTSSGNILTSPNMAAASGPMYLYLNSKSLGPIINAYIQDEGQKIDQICRIPINVQRGGVIFYDDPSTGIFFDFIPGHSFTNFDLYLTLGHDQAQSPLDLKGLGFSVKIGLMNHRPGGVPISQKPSNSNFFRG